MPLVCKVCKGNRPWYRPICHECDQACVPGQTQCSIRFFRGVQVASDPYSLSSLQVEPVPTGNTSLHPAPPPGLKHLLRKL